MHLGFKCSLLAAALVGAGCVGLQADTVSGGTLTTWSPNNLINAATPTPGSPYWNNPSGDGREANIGWCLVGFGQCSLGSTPGALPYYSSTTSPAGQTGAPANLFFTRTSSTPVNVSLLASLTGAQASTIFGWYSVDAAGNPIVGNPTTDLHQLFTGNQVGTSASFLPSGNYGFYIALNQSGGQFGSIYDFLGDPAANFVQGFQGNTVDHFQHTSLFQQNADSYYLGGVGARVCTGTETANCNPLNATDFNDIVVHITTAGSTVPEPSSLALMGFGLLLAGGLFSRRPRV